MRYVDYKKALLDALYAYEHLIKTPCVTVDGKHMIEGPSMEFWDRLSHHDQMRKITSNISTIAKDLEIMQLEIRLNELRNK